MHPTHLQPGDPFLLAAIVLVAYLITGVTRGRSPLRSLYDPLFWIVLAALLILYILFVQPFL